jgi:uncharacterized protein involved in type VI secretion and phage assembly
MKDDKPKRERQPGAAAKNPRANRLKRALRENLKRRKSQARGRGDVAGASSGDAEVSLDNQTGTKPGE